jgi:hypothetical protein
MVDREALLAHVQSIARDFHDQDIVDALPSIIDAVISHGGTPVPREGGVSLRWPLNGPTVPTLHLYLNEYSCLELHLHREGANAAVAVELEHRLVRALPQQGGTLGQRPNFSVESLSWPDSRVALTEVFAWLGEVSVPAVAGLAGPVEKAVRQAVQPGDRLPTVTGRAGFLVTEIRRDGIVLLLGQSPTRTLIHWPALEGVPDYLSGRGWIGIGGVDDMQPTAGTLDSYLKQHINRATAGSVAVVLEKAGVVEIDRGRPARVRLRAQDQLFP